MTAANPEFPRGGANPKGDGDQPIIWPHFPAESWTEEKDTHPKIYYVLTVSDFQILIKTCSIESRNDPSPKSEVVHETKFCLKISYSTNIGLAQLDRY